MLQAIHGSHSRENYSFKGMRIVNHLILRMTKSAGELRVTFSVVINGEVNHAHEITIDDSLARVAEYGSLR